MTCLPNWPEVVTNDPGFRLWQLARPLLPPVPQGGDVLEVGYRDTPWATYCKRADPTLRVVAIDWRPVEPQPGVDVLQGDVMAQAWHPQTWDVVVGLSSFEHVGLGHYARDPLYQNGDSALVHRIRKWLKPGGWCYFDVPYAPEGYFVDGTRCRVYDDHALVGRFGPHEVLGYTRPSVEGWIEKPTRNCVEPRPYYYVALLIRA